MQSTTKAKVFLISETKVQPYGLKGYLEAVAAPEWSTSVNSDIEGLTELIGRSRYRSYETPTRNEDYIRNMVIGGGDDVFKHNHATFALVEVSRIVVNRLTGYLDTVMTTEDLGSVLSNEFVVPVPLVVAGNPDRLGEFLGAFKIVEEAYNKLVDMLARSGDDLSYINKRRWYAALRRLIPEGAATTAMWTTSMRSLHRAIQELSDPKEDEEVRYIFNHIEKIATTRWPAVFPDLVAEKSLP